MRKIKNKVLKTFLFVCLGLSIATIAFAIVPTVPDPPEKPEVYDISKDGCKITYEPPAYDGGSSILGYYIEFRYLGTDKWLEMNNKPWKELTYTINSVHEGARAELRVRAANKVGISTPSAPCDPVEFVN